VVSTDLAAAILRGVTKFSGDAKLL